MLSQNYDGLVSEGVLLAPERFCPIPPARDRARWSAVPEALAHKWIRFADEHGDFAWPALPASAYAAFKREGDLLAYLNLHMERRSILGAYVLAECLEGRGRFLDRIMDGIFAVCEETTWVVPHHNAHIRHNDKESLPADADREVELASSGTGALLAWTWFLLGDRLNEISVRIGERIRHEVGVRLVQPYLERDDYWWMGFAKAAHVNNWNPWCNNNMLQVFLLLEEDAGTRNRGVRKIMRSLDEFLKRYPPDGCCEEGPMYWGASGGGLFQCLDLLYLASDGAIDPFGDPLVRDIGRFIYKVHIDGSYFVDFADGDAKVAVGGAAAGFGRRIGDARLENLGRSAKPAEPPLRSWFFAYPPLAEMFEREAGAASRDAASGTAASHLREAWLPHSQVMTARETEGTAEGLFLAAKGGTNFEPHNHNDVGNFIVYADGLPVLIDLGTENYKAQTFSPERYELWYLKSSYHNLPTVGGLVQQAGEAYRAARVSCSLTDEAAELALDIAGAYPAAARLEAWRRACRLVRGAAARVEIEDAYVFGAVPASLEYSLMSPCRPDVSEPGRIGLPYAEGKRLAVAYDAAALDVRSEEIFLEDSRLQGNWGERVYRVVLTEKQPALRGERVLSMAIER
ncbi:heparinase II/III family protein [Paenibacillus sp. MWE-103]|uniref:Heparinase II/III family protein n=1 Tax=Paenibacillus artemisiicola TaxID=1172618 RepID=A0ABS3W3W2_9BACL|nr:heparinase II/III family protein [Paenibacillus artemisiicola]MBO7742996.1 heparinase II/III family protein [Paenibacillus artemisiicola]